jgi:hypothetical protein
MPKAPLFFRHFGYQSATAQSIVLTLCRELASLVAHRGRRRQARELAALKEASMRAKFWLGSAKVNRNCFVRAVKA